MSAYDVLESRPNLQILKQTSNSSNNNIKNEGGTRQLNPPNNGNI